MRLLGRTRLLKGVSVGLAVGLPMLFAVSCSPSDSVPTPTVEMQPATTKGLANEPVPATPLIPSTGGETPTSTLLPKRSPSENDDQPIRIFGEVVHMDETSGDCSLPGATRQTILISPKAPERMSLLETTLDDCEQASRLREGSLVFVVGQVLQEDNLVGPDGPNEWGKVAALAPVEVIFTNGTWEMASAIGGKRVDNGDMAPQPGSTSKAVLAGLVKSVYRTGDSTLAAVSTCGKDFRCEGSALFENPEAFDAIAILTEADDGVSAGDYLLLWGLLVGPSEFQDGVKPAVKVVGYNVSYDPVSLPSWQDVLEKVTLMGDSEASPDG